MFPIRYQRLNDHRNIRKNDKTKRDDHNHHSNHSNRTRWSPFIRCTNLWSFVLWNVSYFNFNILNTFHEFFRSKSLGCWRKHTPFESGEIYKKINKNIICISLYQKGNQFIFMKMQIYMKERYIFLGLSSETYKVRYCVMDLQNCKRKVIWFFKIELKKYLHINKFGTMGVFVSVGVGISECQSEDSFIRFGAKATQTACSRDFLRDWKKTRKGNVPGQSTEESSQQKRAINRSQGKVTVRKRRLPSEELRPVNLEAWSANARGWVSVPGGCVGILLGYTLTISRCTENHTKVSQTSPFLRLELTQVRACLFFFSSTLSVVYVVSCMFVK